MRTSKVLFWAILLVVYAFNLPAADAKTSGNDVKHHHKQKIAKQKVGDNKAEEVEVLDAMVPYTSTQQFQKDVLQSASPVLVDFSATWCAPCRAMAPSVHNLAVKYSGKLKVYKIDIDDDEDLAED